MKTQSNSLKESYNYPSSTDSVVSNFTEEVPEIRVVLRARNFNKGWDSDASDPYPDEVVKNKPLVMDSDDPDFNVEKI